MTTNHEDQSITESLLSAMTEFNGLEVPKAGWPIVDRLVDEGRACWTSGARGPGGGWKRAEAVDRTEHGATYFDDQGTLRNADGSRSIFDDVDEMDDANDRDRHHHRYYIIGVAVGFALAFILKALLS